MRKVIEFVECYYCGRMLLVDDKAVKYGGDIFCDNDCVFSQIKHSITDIEIQVSDCEEKDDAE